MVFRAKPLHVERSFIIMVVGVDFRHATGPTRLADQFSIFQGIANGLPCETWDGSFFAGAVQ